jgi:hypothetical protein
MIIRLSAFQPSVQLENASGDGSSYSVVDHGDKKDLRTVRPVAGGDFSNGRFGIRRAVESDDETWCCVMLRCTASRDPNGTGRVAQDFSGHTADQYASGGGHAM